VITKH